MFGQLSAFAEKAVMEQVNTVMSGGGSDEEDNDRETKVVENADPVSAISSNG